MRKKPSGRNSTRRNRKPFTKTHTSGWQHVAQWYDGMVGDSGSIFHQKIAIPEVMDMLSLSKGENVLDIGSGQGVLAPVIQKAGCTYTGVDVSPKLSSIAVSRHGNSGSFYVGNAAELDKIPEIKKRSFDAAVFLLSIQDIKAYARAISSAAWALKRTGRIVLFMTHPAFRVPRQSGWGYDKQRKLVYRRVDSYLSRLDVPLREHRKTHETLTRSFHRPLQDYVTALAKSGYYTTKLKEVSEPDSETSALKKSERRARQEIPLFLAIRADRLQKTTEDT